MSKNSVTLEDMVSTAALNIDIMLSVKVIESCFYIKNLQFR